MTSENTITRRSALGRLFGLGAGAAVTAMLPAPLQAAPLAPIAPVLPAMPDWLADAPEWLVPLLADIARGAHHVHESQRLNATYWLELAATGTQEYWAEPLEVQETRRKEEFEKSEKEREAKARERVLRPQRVEDYKVATARIRRLTPSERRRVRRWIAAQPTGYEHPLVRLRLGRRNDGPYGARDFDFIDVAKPTWGRGSQVGAFTHVTLAVAEIGSVLRNPLMMTLQCSHDGGTANAMHVVAHKLVDDWRASA